jgi:hypothetical protein
VCSCKRGKSSQKGAYPTQVMLRRFHLYALRILDPSACIRSNSGSVAKVQGKNSLDATLITAVAKFPHGRQGAISAPPYQRSDHCHLPHHPPPCDTLMPSLFHPPPCDTLMHTHSRSLLLASFRAVCLLSAHERSTGAGGATTMKTTRYPTTCGNTGISASSRCCARAAAPRCRV